MALIDALVPRVNPDADDFWFVESFRAVLISVASCNARTKTKETAAAVKPAGAMEYRKG